MDLLTFADFVHLAVSDAVQGSNVLSIITAYVRDVADTGFGFPVEPDGTECFHNNAIIDEIQMLTLTPLFVHLG
jgi:hypothetical protein